MTISTTFSIHFWLKKSAIKKDGTLPIYARITVDGQRADVSAKQSISEHKWCPIARRIKSKFLGAKEINDILGDTYSKLVNCHKQLSDDGDVISAQAIKLRYLGKDKPVVTINDLIEYHRENGLKKLTTGTAKNYPSTEKYLNRYILKQYGSSDFYLKKINYSFVVNFENYLRH